VINGVFIPLMITPIACVIALKISLILSAQRSSNREDRLIIGFAMPWTFIVQYSGNMVD